MAKVKAIDAIFHTRLNQGEDKNQVICESLQQCFDMLIEDQIEKRSLHIPTTFQVVLDQLLEVAVALKWLPPTMAAHDTVSGHHEWLTKLLSGRIAYFEAAALGEPFGQKYPKPPLVGRAFELEAAESGAGRPNDISASPENTDMAASVRDAIKLFELQPGFPEAQVWMRDRMNKLRPSGTGDVRGQAKFALSNYNIRAATFHRLISTVETQNAFMVLLEHFGHLAWFEFTGIGTPTEIHEGAPSIAPGITRRKQWWTRKGYKRLVDVRAAGGRELEKVATDVPAGGGTGAVSVQSSVGKTPLTANPAVGIMRTAMFRQGLNAPKVATKVRAVLRQRPGQKLKVDRTTIYRILNGKTKRPDPTLRNALIEVLELTGEGAEIVMRELARVEHAPAGKKFSKS